MFKLRHNRSPITLRAMRGAIDFSIASWFMGCLHDPANFQQM